MKRSLSYHLNGRDGHIVYSDEISRLTFFVELGGGDCVAIITIPSESHWISSTKRDVRERDDIIHFIATKATNDQVAMGHFQIKDTAIEIYAAPKF